MRGAVLAMAMISMTPMMACSIPGKHFDVGGDDGSNGSGVQDGSAARDGGGDAGSNLQDAQLADGATGPFSCSGQPLPTSTPPSITLSGVTESLSISGENPVGGVAISGHATMSSATFIQFSSDANGNYSVTIPVPGEQPIDGFLSTTSPGLLETDASASAPFAGDTSLELLMLSQTTLSDAAQISGVNLDPSKANVFVRIVDCTRTSLEGATLTTQPAGQVRYLSGGLPSSSATATDSSGGVIIFNVPPGTVQISGVSGTVTLRTRTVNANGGVLTETELQP